MEGKGGEGRRRAPVVHLEAQDKAQHLPTITAEPLT
jgi:hypothetical protein